MTKRDRYEVAQRVIAAHTTPDGRFTLAVVVAALAAEYRANPELLDPEGLARADVERIDRARRPDPSQATLFDKDAWLPLGETKRVRMADATRDDLDAWYLVELTEHRAHVAAHTRKVEYIESRRRAWTADDACLLDVEARLT